MGEAVSVLVTGGAGYIGSHCLVALSEAGYRPAVLDNFCNSSPRVLERVAQITGAPVPVIQGDVGCAEDLDAAFMRFAPTAVLHLAGLKAVGESAEQPLRYYEANVGGALSLLQAMRRHECRRLVFSSSATVYGAPDEVPVPESAPLRPANPYGHCKRFIEQIIVDEGVADSRLRAINLRYFNPVGAHPSGEIGEHPRQRPNNLMPFIAQVAVGRQPHLQIFGDDYPTPDGTGIRDYIHVMDLAAGHVAALRALDAIESVEHINLGTGRGVSVYEMLKLFREVSGHDLPHEVVARRPGDVACYFADPGKAAALLGWRARFDARVMCEDAWRWQSRHPDGYSDPGES